MIVPQYWAQARQRRVVRGKAIYVRRFGWSDVSEPDAQRMADARMQEAVQLLEAGKPVEPSERKVPYNGAQGMPIREEILARRGDAIVTRNAYGAQCLNTPNVLFADVDLEREAAFCLPASLLLAAAGATALWLGSWWMLLGGTFAALVLARPVGWALVRIADRFRPGADVRALRRVAHFVQGHPEWQLRIYRTPAGFRLLAVHRTFDPLSPEVAECFRALGVDPNYARMSRNQRCFRARVSPKPWRIGISDRMRPRPGVWPVDPKRLPDRLRWVEHYERVARDFAACEFVEAIGSRTVDRAAEDVQRWHDELSRATSRLPIA